MSSFIRAIRDIAITIACAEITYAIILLTDMTANCRCLLG